MRRPGEKTYTQRCRLFVGNLPADITEDEFKRLFAKYGEPGEVFINKGKGFGFIKLVSVVICFCGGFFFFGVILRVLFFPNTNILYFKLTSKDKLLLEFFIMLKLRMQLQYSA